MEDKSSSGDKALGVQELGDSNTSISEHNGTTARVDLSEYGIHRGLKSHHIQLLAISGVIGTDIGRFVDESAGVAMGWVYAYSMIFTAADCTALTGLWSYWFPDINPGVWVAVTLVVVFFLNCLAVKYFGEAEFYASIFKIFLIIGFLLFTFIVVVGGNPKHDRIGFRYWKNPGAFNEAYTTGTTGRFLAIWGVFNTAAFAIGGPDFIANCAPEAENPRRNIPKAVRRVIYRLIVFFILSVFAVGLLVPYNDPTMLTAIATGNGVAKSPFIIAMNRLEIPFLPDLCNAVVITSAWSCTNCLLFQASRTVFGLAKHGRAPKIFAKTTKSGVPLPALILSIAVASLAFMTCNTASAVVLNWFINLGSTAIMIAYILMMVANLQFHRGLKAQGISTATLPFKSRLTPYSNYFAIFWVSIILITNGYGVFIKGHWSFSGFFTAYFTIVLFLVIYLGWKIVKRTSFIKPQDMDFQTGMAEVEAHEATLTVKGPVTRYERFMDWLW
ncbi:putative general amino acid permease protein [Phaeoacremonium minimum UCRPA7]|uniref:Putative general amino acid permease protein n=1 Tax=Phaeoacremonium minimum (strain UCR-PA7) TaxID=1286976 RepID=R8BIG2_PHAM7|nr:putative general amino acid permease protein [Phaeoacremonium minimum UCRPA7]EON99118.1 putative general amino acid permease protein [Phaeoacremonium minimum UCRPA7]